MLALRSIVVKSTAVKLNAGGMAASDTVHLGEITVIFALAARAQRENTPKRSGRRVTRSLAVRRWRRYKPPTLSSVVCKDVNNGD